VSSFCRTNPACRLVVLKRYLATVYEIHDVLHLLVESTPGANCVENALLRPVRFMPVKRVEVVEVVVSLQKLLRRDLFSSERGD